jgi:integrase/recombinase XerD
VFVCALRYGGVRLSDAAGLEQARLSDDGKLFLYQHKTRIPVFIPLPPVAVDALRDRGRLNANPKHFFWSGVGTLESACHSWKRTMYRIFELVGVSGGHIHRFRDTAAVEWLKGGMKLEHVSKLLGHQSIKVTEKSYYPWVQSLQDELEAGVKATWERSRNLKSFKAVREAPPFW